jgi:multidrug resistance efflux pump
MCRSIQWIASTDGMVSVIRAQVQGYLVAQRYREGDPVEKGQLLFEIDARPFQATLSHAEATLSQSEAAEQQAVAALHQAEATLEQSKADVAKQEALWVSAKANYDRFKELVGRGAVAQKDVDDATGAERATYAAVAAAKANVTAARRRSGSSGPRLPRRGPRLPRRGPPPRSRAWIWASPGFSRR